MGNDSRIHWFIENLTARTWCLDILPCLFQNKEAGLKHLCVYYLDGSRSGLFLARLTLKWTGVSVEKLNFRMLDVRDRKDDSIWLNVMFKDSLLFQNQIQNNPQFQEFVNDYGKGNNLSLFLLKESMCAHLVDKDVILRYLFLLKVMSWKFAREKENHERLALFLYVKPWVNEFRQYASKEGIEIKYLKDRSFDIKKELLQIKELKSLMKRFLYFWMAVKYGFQKLVKLEGWNSTKQEDTALQTSFPKIAVEYYGRFNLDKPELFSDLFFYQNSKLSAREILLYSAHSSNLITDQKLAEFRKEGISAIALNSLAAKTPHVPVFWASRQRNKIICNKKEANQALSANWKWLHKKTADYFEQYSYWVDFFTQNNIKTHVTWYKQGSSHCAITDALQSLGGISVVYQRSFEDCAEPWTAVSADVVFGFSHLGAHTGQENQSRVPYYVITGYLEDSRFKLLHQRPQSIRQDLMSHGAKKILAFFDENESKDRRWGMGHDVSQKNYTFLLNKVLENPWLGLILKPKSPGTLQEKLGPDVCALLERAKQTGRCCVLGTNEHFSMHPPATAAINADIVVHGYLTAATAAVESALLGIPTLMMDFQGWSPGTLYKLGQGKVIFRSWDDLWAACQGYWNTLDGSSGIGDWSQMLSTLDPFQDGRAAERMGTYLEWIQEGFKANLSKEEILANAAERYTKLWGKDKILSVNCEQSNQVMV